MDILSLFFLACALSADAFAVSLCKGFCVKDLKLKHYLIVGCYFGGFQALMPLIGFFLGKALASYISNYDHWIAFVLLSFVGAKMIMESRKSDDESCDTSDSQFSTKTMLALAIATSIDALAVGVSFAFLHINIIFSVVLIGCVTFVFCLLGIKIGSKFGTKLKDKAELLGGVVLILIGCKILFGHLFFS